MLSFKHYIFFINVLRMIPFAELVLTPGGVFSRIIVGLIAGWLAGIVTSGGGFGIVRDIVWLG
jgi:hypothetical protein